jgi:hypothetical protein
MPVFNSGVEAEIQNWSAALIESGNPHDVQLGASISLWVGVGMPNERGVNQCVTACAMISRCLSWFGRDAAIVPVLLEVHDSTNTQIGWSGLSTPTWEGTRWSGHCVLYLPDTRSLVDPTLGQIRPPGRQEPALIANLDPAFLTPGIGCESLLSHGDRASYTTLDPQWSPLVDQRARERIDRNNREMDMKLRPGFLDNVTQYVSTINRWQ